MSHDRDDFITAYRDLYNCSETEADRALRGVELAFAERQNTELQQAVDAADGEHLRQTAGYRSAIDDALALHRPIGGDGGPYCETCTQDEKQPPPVGWWVPHPCPTTLALTFKAHPI